MKNLVLIVSFVLFSLPVMADMGRYNNELPSCEELGYAKHTTTSTQALYCPFDNTYSVNIDSMYRGFVERSQLEADYAEYLTDGKTLETFCELEIRTQGEGEYARTLYRCKECKSSTFEAGLCVEFCDVTKFPYSSRPEDLYGQVIECKDNNGTRYAYSECNNGWLADGPRCVMTIADRFYYPYLYKPDGNRGTIDTFKSATNVYYGYKKDTCNSGYSFISKNANVHIGLCIKKCEISNCRQVSETDGVKNYKCDIPDDCVVGDTITYGGTKIGMLLHKATGENDKNLVLGAIIRKQFGMEGYHLTGLGDIDGKLNTKKIIKFCEANNLSCPAAEHCYNYSVSGVTEPALSQGQWFLPAKDEAYYVFDTNMYITAIVNGYNLPFNTDNSNLVLVSKSQNTVRTYGWRLFDYSYSAQLAKNASAYVYPMLAI